MPCGIDDVIERRREGCFSYEGDKWHYGPILCFQRKKMQNVSHGGAPEDDIWQEKRLEEEHPTLEI
jgi:hypothetical protein